MPTLVIIGGGPAGLSAAIYAVRAGLDVHVLYKDDGALGKTDKIENYFGFPDVISGAELLSRGRAQAERLGAQLHRTEVTGIEYADTGFAVKTTDGERHADAVLLATGSPRAVPAITGIRTFEGRGVSYCAVCDAFFYRGRAAAVLGQGEYALEEARVLLPVAGSVTLLTNGQSAPENLPDGLAVDDAAVDHQHAAGLDVILELIQGGTVHGHDDVGLVHQGGGHGLVGHDDGAVGGTAAHLGAVGRQPGDVLAVQHAGHRHELTDQEHALTAETGENKGLFHVTWPPCLCKHPEDSKESCSPPARS